MIANIVKYICVTASRKCNSITMRRWIGRIISAKITTGEIICLTRKASTGSLERFVGILGASGHKQIITRK